MYITSGEMNQQPNWVIVYSEICLAVKSLDTNQETIMIHSEVYDGNTGLDKIAAHRLLKFPFSSSKSLEAFLELFKQEIAESTVPYNDLTPDEILAQAFNEKIITIIDVRNYLLEPSEEYIYSLIIKPVQDGRDIAKNLQPPVARETASVSTRPAELDESVYNDNEDD